MKGSFEMIPIDPMQQPPHLANALRCGAKTRTGDPCKSPAVKERQRCRMHGGTNKGGRKGNRNAWIHGNRSAEAEAQLKIIAQTNRQLRLIARVKAGLRLRPNEQDQLLELMLQAGGKGPSERAE